jgi:xanthine dehydrogenase accessory factor
MHLGTNALIRFFKTHRNDAALVLVTVIGTEGSTYRKPGAMMLISENEQYEGMISGGCLEGDLLHHAAGVFASGQPAFVTYDMHADDQLVWSLGLGCDGIIHLLLQRLENPRGFEFLDYLQNSLLARKQVMTGLVTASGDDSVPVGTLAMTSEGGSPLGSEVVARVAADAVSDGWPDWRFRNVTSGAIEVMLIHQPPYPRILLCGAGPDAVPVARQFRMLDWECQLVDHRPAFARADRFESGCVVTQCRPESLSSSVDLDEIDAAVIMSHHLDNDAAYLKQLASAPPRYLGVLGPSARRDRLKELAGLTDADADISVFGPVGLDIGAEMPESIALAIAAEIHAVLNKRDGHSLTGPAFPGGMRDA